MANMKWFYDEDTGRYVVKGARILFPNFAGDEQDYNPAGKRNFRLELDESLGEELKDRGVYVRTRETDDPDNPVQRLTKIGVYQDADIRLLSGKAMTPVPVENLDIVDREFRKGHITNGKIDLEFHISRNTKVSASSPYARVDTMIIPVRKSRLLEEYEEYDDEGGCNGDYCPI